MTTATAVAPQTRFPHWQDIVIFSSDGPQPQSILKVSDGLFQPPLTVVVRRHMLAPGFLLVFYDRT